MSKFTIVEDKSGKTGYSPRGKALELWRSKRPEVMLAGPAETGKTYACLQKIDTLLWKYAGSQAMMVRKTYNSLHGTALQTYLRKVLTPDSPVRTFGGERPEWFDYPNGSRLYVAGLDKAGKVLSSERDFIYVNQAEELSLSDWETLSTRATGRAGNAPYSQLSGDCNPGPAHHWIRNRPQLQPLLESRHEDNPVLWDEERRQWTEQGQRTLAVLDALTGVRKERLRHGRWVSAEGTVYQFDARVHLLDPFPIPDNWTRFCSIDFGWTNPFVCQWWALDPDGRLYLYREIYHTARTVRQHAMQIAALSQGERIDPTIADHDREDRETLLECGIASIPAEKAISRGIQAVESRLALAADGRPRLFVLRGSLVERDELLAEQRKPVCCEQEFDVYVWPKGADGKAIKEVPVDMNNHSLDALRYAVMWADARDRVGGGVIGTGQPRPASGGQRGEAMGGDFRHWPKGV